MKVWCRHGYFTFEESRAGEASEFVSQAGLELVAKDRHFVFADLSDAPDYCLAGQLWLGAAITVSYAGRPDQIMEANELVYNFNTGLVVPIATITQRIQLSPAGNFYVSPGLILPGSLTDGGQRVRDYAAWFSTKAIQRFIYSEVGFVD